MRLMLVEDDHEMASTLGTLLRAHGMVVDVARSLAQAERYLKGGQHQLLLLDRRLPDGDGADFVPRARALCHSLPIIMLTALHSLEDRVRGLDVGADDYLTKPFAPEELLARIRAISRRPAQIAIPNIRLGALQFDVSARSATIAGQPFLLPRRQLLVLEALLSRHGRTVSRRALEEAVYGFDEDIQSNALDAHVSKLRRALETSGAGLEIHVLRGVGYLIKEAP
ncbi:MAG: response regulator transcription factor [Candidatus Dactylopiibacterium sp.]|nr:response regulator transcription factor [Candidatus Dactylopiibacterium sp.]